MHSVIAPALLFSIRHYKHFSIDQSTRQAHRISVRAGNLPNEGFLGHVPANLDDVAGFQNILCKTASVELKNRGTFDGPPMSLSIRAVLVQKYKAVRIDLVKLDYCSLHVDGLRGVVICQRMMSQRTRRNERHKNYEPSCRHLLHLEPPVSIVCSLTVFDPYPTAWLEALAMT